MAFTKADIVNKIADQLDFNRKESAELLEEVFLLIKSTLQSGEEVKLSGFGKFEIQQKADRIGRNPITGESLTIEARKIVSYRPSTALRNKINQ